VQLEEEKLDEFEDTIIGIICWQSFADYANKEEMTVQLGFVSTISWFACAFNILK
jgi:hypothetical protein